MEYKKEYSENLISIINNFEFIKEEEKVLNESLLKLYKRRAWNEYFCNDK
ncbi:hypothetical protein QTH02_14060 [Clostridium perfringens]|nr:hypothetical protein [Clostridium perfringens]